MPEANQTLATRAVSEGATLYIIAWLWVFFRFVDLMKVKLANNFIKQDKPLAIHLLRPGGTVIKSVVTLTAVLIWFENLGFSASTLLAGLGIGGLAIALAAQKTVENIIAAITLYTSAPVRIGDFCRFVRKFQNFSRDFQGENKREQTTVKAKSEKTRKSLTKPNGKPDKTL